jgi:hypothetical protein
MRQRQAGGACPCALQSNMMRGGMRGGACPCTMRGGMRGGMKKGMKGGNYAIDVTSAEFQGFPYKSEKSTVVSFPGTPGVMDLKDYKNMMEDEDREGYDPTA